jgi:O-antigen/teichoic acid export membrane protein
MIEPGEADDAIVARAAAGARLLTARGAAMRVISVASNLALIALVTPAELGLLAVVRGVTGLAGDTSDLGFAWALLRRRDPPTREEYRALAGVQLVLILGFLVLGATVPSLVGGRAAPRWGRWILPVLCTMLTVPLGTGARIRIERKMDFRRIAFADLSGVTMMNIALLAFAAAGHFAAGIFIAAGGMILYNNLLLWSWAPGPLPGFDIPQWRRLGREFAGFTLGHLGSMLNASGTPLLIATLFGLPVAGLWSFASRLGNVLQLAFEGFRRAAIPAAGLLAGSQAALSRLMQETLLGAARYTLPLIAAFWAALPVVGWLLPQWAPAVPLAQLYVLGFGVAGIVTASVVPASVALSGSRIVIAEQFAPLIVGWPLFAGLALLHDPGIALVVLPMQAATIAAVWRAAGPAMRPRWTRELRLPVIALCSACAVVMTAERTGVRPLIAAFAAAAAFVLISVSAYRRTPVTAAAEAAGINP